MQSGWWLHLVFPKVYPWTPRLLLVLFIIDIPVLSSKEPSTLALFTDDAKRLQALRSKNDCLALQSYIENLNKCNETYTDWSLICRPVISQQERLYEYFLVIRFTKIIVSAWPWSLAD